MPCSEAHGGDDKGLTALQWAIDMPRIASRRACAESKQVCASRRPLLAVPLVVLAVCSLLVLQAPGARAQQDATTYKNATQILSILGSSWMGSGYDDSGDAHYLFRPKKDMTGERLCLLILSAVLRLHAAFAWSSCLVLCLFPCEQMLRVICINIDPMHVSFGRAAADAPPEVPALGRHYPLFLGPDMCIATSLRCLPSTFRRAENPEKTPICQKSSDHGSADFPKIGVFVGVEAISARFLALSLPPNVKVSSNSKFWAQIQRGKSVRGPEPRNFG